MRQQHEDHANIECQLQHIGKLIQLSSFKTIIFRPHMSYCQRLQHTNGKNSDVFEYASFRFP